MRKFLLSVAATIAFASLTTLASVPALVLTTDSAEAACGSRCQQKCRSWAPLHGMTQKGCEDTWSYYNSLRGDPGYEGRRKTSRPASLKRY